MTLRLYRKGNSFQSVVGDFSAQSAADRIINLHLKMNNFPLEQEVVSVLEKLFADLELAPAAHTNETFYLRPHVIEEISRVSEKNLPRYLYHRFRYDVFPVKKEIDSYPPCVQIEPTSICNFRCVFCFQTDPLLTQRKHGHAGQMSLDLFKKIIDEIEGNVEFVTLASRGEPLLAKGIEEMLSYASGKFLGLKMNTNATFLDESKAHAILQAGLNTLVFSIDAADARTYEQLRINGDFEKVIGNIERFQDIKMRNYPDSTLITRVSGVAFDRKKQDHKKIEDFWRGYVDQVAFVDYNPWENSYLKAANSVTESCSDLWRRCFVWWDGKINPCDVDYRSFLSPGSIEFESLKDIWAGKGYSSLRELHLKRQRQSLSPCQGCVSV